MAELPEWEGTHQDIESCSWPRTGHSHPGPECCPKAPAALAARGGAGLLAGRGSGGDRRGRTCFWVTLRTSPTYMILPWCLTMPTVMESSHTSEAMYLSTWMPRSFSTNKPVGGAMGSGHEHTQQAPSPVPTCANPQGCSLPAPLQCGTPGVETTMGVAHHPHPVA